MSKPLLHAQSSVKRYGGVVEDYLPIHNLMDSSKAAIADNRHRALTHNSWFVGTILEQIFGTYLINADDKKVSVRDIGEQHVLEDFAGKFIPTPQDYLAGIPFEDWMQNEQGVPPSFIELDAYARRKARAAIAKKSIEHTMRTFNIG